MQDPLRTIHVPRIQAHLVAGFDCSKDHRRVCEVVRANICQGLKVLPWTQVVVQPPSNPVDDVGESSICDLAEPCFVTHWRDGIFGVQGLWLRGSNIVDDMI